MVGATPAKRLTGKCTLAIGVGADGALPSEFRLFVSGWNDTENGRFLFDADAAASVMAAHEKWGVDLMIDLEHQALNSGTPPEPNARDARGWFRLELRPDGSLWAVGVSWTPDGEQRLRDKRQRYVSPAFSVDPETSRVTAIINVALVAIPATHDTPALVAASAAGDGMLDKALIAKALEAIAAGDEKGALDLLKSIVASAAGGDPDAATEDAPPPVGDGGADEAQEMAATPADAPAGDPKKEDPAAVAAASARLMRLSGRPSLIEALADAEVWRASHLKLESETQRLAEERKVLEAAERRKLCVELVSLGGRAPATVWATPESVDPKPYLAKMPIADLRAMHADEIASKGGKVVQVKPPVTASASTFETPHGPFTLSAREIANCGNDPKKMAKYAATRAAIVARGTTVTGV